MTISTSGTPFAVFTGGFHLAVADRVLVFPVFRPHDAGEDTVHERDNAGTGPVGCPERLEFGLEREIVEHRHIGPPEAVDGLLGVPHGEELRPGIAGDHAEDVELEGIGVLKLVHEQMAESRRYPTPYGGVPPEGRHVSTSECRCR